MTVLSTYTQQPADKLDYDIPFSLATGDSIQSAAATVTPSGLTVSTIITSSTVKLWVEGGTDGVLYKVEILVTTANGRKKQVEVKFRIKDY